MLDIIIDRNECNLCGLCIDACPAPCLSFDAGETIVVVSDLDKCLICRSCEDHCPVRCLNVAFPEWTHSGARASGEKPSVAWRRG